PDLLVRRRGHERVVADGDHRSGRDRRGSDVESMARGAGGAQPRGAARAPHRLTAAEPHTAGPLDGARPCGRSQARGLPSTTYTVSRFAAEMRKSGVPFPFVSPIPTASKPRFSCGV